MEKEELLRDTAEQVKRIQAEKDSSDAKYKKSRKSHKELEQTLNKQTSKMEREKAVLLEKYQSLE